jgi:hypothetical protein
VLRFALTWLVSYVVLVLLVSLFGGLGVWELALLLAVSLAVTMLLQRARRRRVPAPH